MDRSRLLPAAALALALAVAGCASTPAALPDPSSRPMPRVFGAEAVAVTEAYLTVPRPADEIDSVATWTAPGGETWLLATAKETHQVAVYDADTGAYRLSFGGPGKGPGQFNRPNGIATFGDLLFGKV